MQNYEEQVKYFSILHVEYVRNTFTVLPKSSKFWIWKKF